MTSRRLSTAFKVTRASRVSSFSKRVFNQWEAHSQIFAGIVVATHEGSVIRSTLDNIQTPQIATLVTQLAAKGKGVVRDLDPEVRALGMFVNWTQNAKITNRTTFHSLEFDQRSTRLWSLRVSGFCEHTSLKLTPF